MVSCCCFQSPLMELGASYNRRPVIFNQGGTTMPRTSLNLIIALGCLLAVALACNFSASTANISNLKLGKDKNVSSESSSFTPSDTIYAVGTVSNAPGKVKVKGLLAFEDVAGQQ